MRVQLLSSESAVMGPREELGRGQAVVEIELANSGDIVCTRHGVLPADRVRRATVRGVTQTGVMHLVLPEWVVKELGLPIDPKLKALYHDRPGVTRQRVTDVWLRLCGRQGTYSAVVEPDRQDAVIGAIVLQDLDL